MNARRNSAKMIFLEAVENCPPERWDAYLEEACGGDADLRRRVRLLLDAHQGADSLIDQPGSAPSAAATRPLAEGPGTVIGPYKLMEQIGEGGMGVVYVADQTKPMRRKVALKIIKPGMDTKQVIARFEAERQALAMMDHPNIARVHDGGTTDSGRPYFVMELVRGIPITEYCDRERLSIPGRLALLVLVCRAVQHAHQKGIIHRDLKPSNILVTVIDGSAVPKIIDFGVAKATGASLTERTLYTAFHQFVGTPLYMSPEQADLAGVDIDTRSDIYSLGVLLYELLTGTTPFDQDTFRTAAFDEVRRIIREQDPPKPSTRLSSLGETLTTVSERRKADPRRLGPSLRGELDWIVMKALEKDRRRRYETANDFASDLMRFLTDQPVEACPPSAGYRFGKFARRNRVSLVTAILVAAALLIGTTISVWQAHEAQRARRLADRRLSDEKQARNDAEIQRRRAQQDFDQAIERMVGLYRKLCSTGASSGLPPETRRALAEAIIGAFQGIVNGQDDNKVLRFKRAKAFFHLAEIYGWEGKPEQLVGACEQEIAILEALTAEYPLETVHWQELGVARNMLATHLMKAGRTFEAMRQWREAADAYHEGVKVGSSDGRGLMPLIKFLGGCPWGDALTRAGRLKEAEAAYREALADLKSLSAEIRDQPGARKYLAYSRATLGAALTRAGRPKEAEVAYREALADFDSLSAEIQDQPDVQNNLAWLLATCPLPQVRDPSRAVQHARRAVEKEPGNRVIRNTLGVALYRAGHWEESVAALRKSMELGRDYYAIDWFFLAMAHWQLRHQDEARTWFDKAVAWMERYDPNDGALFRLRAEAEALLGVKPPDAKVSPESVPSTENSPD